MPLAAEVAAAAAEEFLPIVAGWVEQAIAGGHMTPEQAEALWAQSKTTWDAAYARWKSAQSQ